MNAVETFKVGKLTVEIYVDEDPQNPRKDCDNDDIMVCFHKRYNLGDDVDKHGYRFQDFNSWDEIEAHIVKDHNPVVIKPIYMYDHSGITIATTPFYCPWDSGQVGFVFMPRNGAYNAYGVKRITKEIKEKCEQYIDATIKTYDQFITGDVYGYIIKDENNEQLDSCCGFYGKDYVMEEATNAAKAIDTKQ